VRGLFNAECRGGCGLKPQCACVQMKEDATKTWVNLCADCRKEYAGRYLLHPQHKPVKRVKSPRLMKPWRTQHDT
jgi:hypothetical protein